MSEKTVLFVDDEVYILNSIRRLLRDEDYRLLTANSGKEGLTILEKQPVQLVISDQRMPGMAGIEFLQAVRELYPDTVRVMISGYAEVAVVVDSINKGEIYRFLAKPWTDVELRTSIRQCLAHYDILQENRSMMEQIRRQNEELRRLNEGLEEIVEARTHSLHLSQEILETLPLPVVGVSREGMLVMANHAARQMFPSMHDIPPGRDMRKIFPPAVADAIGLRLDGAASADPPVFTLDGRLVRMHVKPLGKGESLRGCVLILETSGLE
jgi:response regulator RpfG family c-di-GMP phosphodiesterase